MCREIQCYFIQPKCVQEDQSWWKGSSSIWGKQSQPTVVEWYREYWQIERWMSNKTNGGRVYQIRDKSNIFFADLVISWCISYCDENCTLLWSDWDVSNSQVSFKAFLCSYSYKPHIITNDHSLRLDIRKFLTNATPSGHFVEQCYYSRGDQK